MAIPAHMKGWKHSEFLAVERECPCRECADVLSPMGAGTAEWALSLPPPSSTLPLRRLEAGASAEAPRLLPTAGFRSTSLVSIGSPTLADSRVCAAQNNDTECMGRQ